MYILIKLKVNMFSFARYLILHVSIVNFLHLELVYSNLQIIHYSCIRMHLTDLHVLTELKRLFFIVYISVYPLNLKGMLNMLLIPINSWVFNTIPYTTMLIIGTKNDSYSIGLNYVAVLLQGLTTYLSNSRKIYIPMKK